MRRCVIRALCTGQSSAQLRANLTTGVIKHFYSCNCYRDCCAIANYQQQF
jgi:hypothetical protein